MFQCRLRHWAVHNLLQGSSGRMSPRLFQCRLRHWAVHNQEGEWSTAETAARFNAVYGIRRYTIGHKRYFRCSWQREFQCRLRHWAVHNEVKASRSFWYAVMFQCRLRHWAVHNSIPTNAMDMLALKHFLIWHAVNGNIFSIFPNRNHTSISLSPFSPCMASIL